MPPRFKADSLIHTEAGRSSRTAWIAAILVVLIVPSALYYYTCAPGIGMGDTALMMEYVHYGRLSTAAYIHNIANLIGRIFYQLPGDNFARKVNLASAFTGGLAVFLFGTLLLRVLRSKLVALLCTGVLMVSNSMWWHSTIAESYAVNALFTIIALWLLFASRRLAVWRLLLLFLAGGLVLFNHVQMLIIVGGAGIALMLTAPSVLRARAGAESPGWMLRFGRFAFLALLGLVAFSVGLIPWLLVFRQEVGRIGLSATLYAMRGAKFQGLFFEGDLVDGLTDSAYLLFQQFPGPFLLAVPVGVVILARKYEARQFWAIAGMLAVNTGFFSLYDTWDRFAFLLPSFILLAFAGSFAVDALWRRLSAPAPRGAVVAALLFCVAFPPWFYARLSEWGEQPGFWRRFHGNAYMGNIIDLAEYKANPNKRHWRDAEIYANLLFAKLPRGSVYVDDDSRTYYPIEYFRRFYRKRPDLRVMLINSWGFSHWGLTRTQFIKQATAAYRYDQNFFLPSTGHPYRKMMPARDKRFLFQLYRLDEEHHIYRLMSARERGVRP